MVTRLSHLLFCLLLIVLLSAVAFAGTDVELRDANGALLKPSQMDKVSIRKSCGDCHEVDKNAASVHFNRAQKGADPESSSCLECHVPKKDAFNANGTVKAMTTTPEDATCLGCHSDLGITEGHPGAAHEGRTCISCHKNAGHQTKGAATCEGCHTGKGEGPKPKHEGIPSLHLKRLACETCHVAKTTDGKAPGYILSGGKIVPVAEGGTVLYHNVAKASDCLGKKGCEDCHSQKSSFFFGTTTTTGKDGAPVKMVNYKSMHLEKSAIEISAVRESYIKRYAGWLILLVFAMTLVHYIAFGPHKVKPVANDPEIQRFTLYERAIHWLAMLSFAYLAITGILFMLHIESPAVPVRHIHGQVGAAFILALIGLVTTWWRHAVFSPCDRQWICKMGGYLWIKGCCPAEKFNAGQKAFFWAVAVIGGIVISATGIVLLFGKGWAPSWVYTLHDLAAIGLIAGIVAHVYLGIFANPGTITSIISGRVKKSWAEHHHSEWAKKHTK